MRRRPPFALVLVALLIPVVVAIALSSGNGSTRRNPPAISASGPARACATARAQATATARATVRAQATARVPVSVTARARRGAAVVSAGRSETVVQTLRVARGVTVRVVAPGKRTACARDRTREAAHTAALNRAYELALKGARGQASARARQRLATLAARLRAAAFADARTRASVLARSEAATRRTVLMRQAQAAARRAANSWRIAQPAAAGTPASASSTGRYGSPTASATGA